MIFLFAFFGGMILNLMPCVLPVIAIKILTITQSQGSTGKNTICYVLGICATFLALSLIIIIAATTGTLLGWGFHMQSPTFVMLLTYVFFLMGLNLLGLYEINFNIQMSGTINMFMYGILTTVASTPCLAPFLSASAGFAITQRSYMIILIFQIIALGLAFPYILLSLFPFLLKFVPKSKIWNQNFKEFLSFPLFITVIWLIWVLQAQTSHLTTPLMLCSMLGITATLWLVRLSNKVKKIFLPIVMAIITITILIAHDLTKEKDSAVEVMEFSQQKIEELVENQNKVFVVITASWCATCKVNEALVLNTSIFKKTLKENNVYYMLADWSKRDDSITQYMHSLGYSGVPMYILHQPNKNPQILPTMISANILKGYLIKIY